ncbi:unnamed protein product [Prorocentrum cordatum]|uniref:Eukaryotic translation initiation factor 2A n=1 Tax=Prorocentrum cordatum TaxID=2364126 RepID=A0ABN9WXQ8_9DINO|nr:unnamed protein product [Polarella glacialis]
MEEGAPVFDWANQSPPLPSAKAASWSPDGRRLAIATGRPKGSKRGGIAPGAAPAIGDGADAAPAAGEARGSSKEDAGLSESGLNANAAEFAPAGVGLNVNAVEFVPAGAGSHGDVQDPGKEELPHQCSEPASATAAGECAEAAPVAAGEGRGPGQDDQSDGLVVVEFSGREVAHSCSLNTASKTLHLLQWSPLGTFLVVQPAQRRAARTMRFGGGPRLASTPAWPACPVPPVPPSPHSSGPRTRSIAASCPRTGFRA